MNGHEKHEDCFPAFTILHLQSQCSELNNCTAGDWGHCSRSLENSQCQRMIFFLIQGDPVSMEDTNSCNNNTTCDVLQRNCHDSGSMGWKYDQCRLDAFSLLDTLHEGFIQIFVQYFCLWGSFTSPAFLKMVCS